MVTGCPPHVGSPTHTWVTKPSDVLGLTLLLGPGQVPEGSEQITLGKFQAILKDQETSSIGHSTYL